MTGIRKDDADAITEINITPMVDVVLVLLVIFMATAPLLSRRALSVQLPKSARAERAATETVRVELNAKGEIVYEGQKLALADLERELKRLIELQPATHVALAADEKRPYGDIVTVLDTIKGSGVKRIGLEARPR
ncbi:MAG: biopolymer transporter ExbD [Elusimicrobia bacterium]|nr:biopolymer transporter ExbD [Elusimicrobiota bacterium]